MKKLFTLLFAIASATAYAEPTEVAPSVKTPTSFAVFIDRASYDRCREAVEAYRAAVQADGLGTYIICDDWQSPTRCANASSPSPPTSGCRWRAWCSSATCP